MYKSLFLGNVSALKSSQAVTTSVKAARSLGETTEKPSPLVFAASPFYALALKNCLNRQTIHVRGSLKKYFPSL